MTRAEHERRLRRAVKRLDDAAEARDEAILAAREDGLSLREIASAVGLSPEWVRRIAERVSR